MLKPESKRTPCHIVFNSGANFHGHVLNEYNAKGPDMLNNSFRCVEVQRGKSCIRWRYVQNVPFN